MALQMQPYQKYTKIASPAPPSNPDQHEIRVTTNKPPKIYIERALFLVRKKNLKHVLLKASGAAISTLCISAEIIRNTLKNLHQLNRITNTTIVDVYEPNEEGLDTVTVERKMAILEVKLMKEATVDEINEVGYQPPLNPDFNPEEKQKRQMMRGGFRGKPRGEREPMRFNRFRPYGQRRGTMTFRGRFRSRGNFNQRVPQQYPDREQYQYRGGRPRRMMYMKFSNDYQREEGQQQQQQQEKEVTHRPVMRRPMSRRPGMKY